MHHQFACHASPMHALKYTSLPVAQLAIDTEIKAKRSNLISDLITFRITKAKAKVKCGVGYLCGPECGKSSVPININTQAKADKYFGEINFTLMYVSTLSIIAFLSFHAQYDWTTGAPDGLTGEEKEGLLDYQGGWGSFPLYGGTFPRSYSVLTCHPHLEFHPNFGFPYPFQFGLFIFQDF